MPDSPIGFSVSVKDGKVTFELWFPDGTLLVGKDEATEACATLPQFLERLTSPDQRETAVSQLAAHIEQMANTAVRGSSR